MREGLPHIALRCMSLNRAGLLRGGELGHVAQPCCSAVTWHAADVTIKGSVGCGSPRRPSSAGRFWSRTCGGRRAAHSDVGNGRPMAGRATSRAERCSLAAVCCRKSDVTVGRSTLPCRLLRPAFLVICCKLLLINLQSVNLQPSVTVCYVCNQTTSNALCAVHGKWMIGATSKSVNASWPLQQAKRGTSRHFTAQSWHSLHRRHQLHRHPPCPGALVPHHHLERGPGLRQRCLRCPQTAQCAVRPVLPPPAPLPALWPAPFATATHPAMPAPALVRAAGCSCRHAGAAAS